MTVTTQPSTSSASESSIAEELEAMGTIGKALADLTVETRQRVLHWINSKFGTGGPVALKQRSADGSAAKADFADFETLPDLFAVVAAEKENDRALVAAAWIQLKSESGDFTAQTINASLNNMGVPLSNVTRTLDRLMEQNPKLVIQLQKSGKSKQARKTYKVTTAGLAQVQAMLGQAASE